MIGVGGSANLVTNLVRSGLGKVTLVDPDTVSGLNIVRQDYCPSDVGAFKVGALADAIHRIDPSVKVHPLPRDVTEIPEETWEKLFGTVDLFISTTDCFAAQARTNEMALTLGKPAIWPGIYEGGVGGELVFWQPGLPCYRCLLGKRYEAQAAANAEGRSLDPPSDGTTIFEDAFIDAIAGMLAVGLLTQGADNRYGCLIEQIGDRNFLQVKLDPDYRLNGRDVVRERLGIAPQIDTFFAWNVAARRDPARGKDYCPDCERFGFGDKRAVKLRYGAT